MSITTELDQVTVNKDQYDKTIQARNLVKDFYNNELVQFINACQELNQQFGSVIPDDTKAAMIEAFQAANACKTTFDTDTDIQELLTYEF